VTSLKRGFFLLVDFEIPSCYFIMISEECKKMRRGAEKWAGKATKIWSEERTGKESVFVMQ